MTRDILTSRLRSMIGEQLPLPGGGRTAERHRRLMEIGRQDLSLARLAEAHYDAVAILSEANREPESGKIYGVWAAELPGAGLQLAPSSVGYSVNGVKMFASGASLIDKALVTVASPEHRLAEVDLRSQTGAIAVDESDWKTAAFRETGTAKVTFTNVRIAESDLVGDVGWYLKRPGFWHGACGPASCWAGGAEGLVDFASRQSRRDPHTLAHLAAMHSQVWALKAFLTTAGEEIDSDPRNCGNAGKRALIVRHLVEQACQDVLQRFARAYGPYPLAMEEQISRRFQELTLYLRQSHAERDLEALGRLLTCE